MAPPEWRPEVGYWGPVTATIDWCEGNYEVGDGSVYGCCWAWGGVQTKYDGKWEGVLLEGSAYDALFVLVEDPLSNWET